MENELKLKNGESTLLYLLSISPRQCLKFYKANELTKGLSQNGKKVLEALKVISSRDEKKKNSVKKRVGVRAWYFAKYLIKCRKAQAKYDAYERAHPRPMSTLHVGTFRDDYPSYHPPITCEGRTYECSSNPAWP